MRSLAKRLSGYRNTKKPESVSGSGFLFAAKPLDSEWPIPSTPYPAKMFDRRDYASLQRDDSQVDLDAL